ncbi:MAG: carboxypeptidase regulatory-like domain-containing protein [Ruminococcus callidus]|nr:carboxypeptidase regulatory-like domain-containing protein [Ruminococcus callidus]
MTCKKCGLELKRSDKFCPRCGEIAPKQKTSTTKKTLIIFLTVIVVAIACSIIITIISVNSKPSQKVYNDTSRVFEENSKSTVKEVLSESETESKTESEIETKAEKGIITGQVLDDLGNPIENAEVCAIVVRETETKDNAENISDTSGSNSEIKTKTDKEGKYSIECLVGEYKIQITADGYDGFINEKYVTVSTGKTVSIEKINLKSKSSEFDSLITNIINNESIWISNLEKEEKDFKDVGLDTSGNEYLWFQDMNMDGNLELVTMSKYFNDMDLGGDYRYCSIYSCNNSKFNIFLPANTDADFYSTTFGICNGKMDDSTFSYYLWQKKDGSFVYLSDNSIDVMLLDLSYLSLGGCAIDYPIIKIYDDDYCYIDWKDFVSSDCATEVSISDGKKYYDNYFDGAVSYKTNTKKIKLSDYQNKTEDEKRKLLEESAEAWSYSKDGSTKKPFEDIVNDIVEKYGSTTSDYEQFSIDSNKTTPINNIKGQINCHGGKVVGFTTDYVLNGGSVGIVRSDLADTWHVTAKNSCTSYGIVWYELWDSDDGDYYGWVDSNYIDFY